MGFRDVYNQLKGMKPLAQGAIKKLTKVAAEPAVKGIVGAVVPGVAALGAAKRISKSAQPIKPIKKIGPGKMVNPISRYRAMSPIKPSAKRPR